jgi:hypothetical protein
MKKQNLNNLTGSELVALYNEAAESLGRKTVKKFSNKATALKRTAAILAEVKPAKAEKKARTPKTFDLEFVGVQHKFVSGSIREQFYRVMRRASGASWDDLVAIVKAVDAERGTSGNELRRARSYVRIMHTYHGYGIKTLADGNVTVVES